MNEPAFFTYVAHVLVPTLRPGDIVILDNLSAHKSPRVEAVVRSAGAYLVFLPPSRRTTIRSSSAGPASSGVCAKPKLVPSIPCLRRFGSLCCKSRRRMRLGGLVGWVSST